MSNVNVYASDDYAGMSTNNSSFYYGYEFRYCDKCKQFHSYGEESEDCDEYLTWAFKGSLNGKEYHLRFEQLPNNGIDRWNVVECLLAGIGTVLNKGE